MNKNSSQHTHQHLVLPIFWIWTILINVVSHCFIFKFSNSKWCWGSFHMIIYHLYIFFCEVSVQKLCPFLNFFFNCWILRIHHMFWIQFLYELYVLLYFVSFCDLSFLNVFDLSEDSVWLFYRTNFSLHLYPYISHRVILIGTQCKVHGRVSDSHFFHEILGLVVTCALEP